MLTGPDWRPHVYTDSELDLVEKRHSGTLEEFAALICREIRKMSEKEKFVLRCGMRKAFKMATPKIGNTVTVELFTGHEIRGVVKAAYDSVSGKKVQVSSGDITVKVEEGQIILE
jgi:hypothetical protein